MAESIAAVIFRDDVQIRGEDIKPKARIQQNVVVNAEVDTSAREREAAHEPSNWNDRYGRKEKPGLTKVPAFLVFPRNIYATTLIGHSATSFRACHIKGYPKTVPFYEGENRELIRHINRSFSMTLSLNFIPPSPIMYHSKSVL